MNTEAIQNEVNEIIKSAEAMYNFSRMNRATKKAQNELRELGLEQFVPAWVMQDGARADRVVNELIKAMKQDGTQIERGTGHMTTDGDGVYVAGRTIPASKLYTLLNETTEETEETDDTATREQAEEIAREVWGYQDPERWDTHGVNTTSLWQQREGHWTGHWCVTRASAYDSSYVRMGRTMAHLLKHQKEIEDNRNKIAEWYGW